MINVLDKLARTRGVGQALLYALENYSMRIWFQTDVLTSLNLAPSDVIKAIQSQNVQAAVGRLGAAPMPDDQALQLSLQTQGRLASTEEFEAVIVRSNPDGSVVRVGDIARVELGAQSRDSPAASMAARDDNRHLSDAGIERRGDGQAHPGAMEDMKPRFPEGIDYKVTYDTTVSSPRRSVK